VSQLPRKLLVANRGEIAIRVMRAAAGLGIASVAVFSEDDAASLHTRRADSARALRGMGAAAYLDAEQIIEHARASGCDAVHPGYGFLSESAAFAGLCRGAGLVFVGPSVATLAELGDKLRARALAARCGVPLLAASPAGVSPAQARAFLAALPPGRAMMMKAVAGGGGRGIRIVRDPDEVDAAFTRCESEARAAFGDGALYVEECLAPARHVEVQIAGDGSGRVCHLWERECSLQRRHQKLVEIAPSPGLGAGLRKRLTGAAVRMAEAVHYEGLGTFEFLIGGDRFFFIEANPRLQVEHTVTESVTGIDLVELQLRLAGGASLGELGLEQSRVPPPRGFALQLRINVETLAADGTARPSGGTLGVFEAPNGPGIRVDSHGYAGYTIPPRFDSLLAKVVAHSPSERFGDVVARAYRALCELRIEGVATNVGFLQSLLRHPDLAAARLHTRFVEEKLGELLAAEGSEHPRLFFESASPPRDEAEVGPGASAAASEGLRTVAAPMQGSIVSLEIDEGDRVLPGQPLLVMEAMKMEHVIAAPCGGRVRHIAVVARETVLEGQALARIEEDEALGADSEARLEADLDRVRPDLAAVRERHALGLDAARPEAVARRRKTGQRTARENVSDLCDPGSFVEYGALAVAAQRRRRDLDDLIRNTPADGLVAGIGRVNGDLFDEWRSRCMVLSYDYTVLAGTQGMQNHRKKDRMFELAALWKLPVVLFAEGGGGRPGDTDAPGISGLDCLAFSYFGRLSGLVPLIGITSGRCFAGNAALLGCCDVIIATAGSNIGMGGPAMIEGGGLGIFRPEEVGPLSVQTRNGVVDVAVDDEEEAVRVARRYLAYFQGPLPDWSCADQRLLRAVIPENRLRVYDVRSVVEILADTDSVLELRRDFAPGMLTALIRIEGRPLGLIANNPLHLAGAIDSDGADKASRFMQLCDAFGLPLLFLCDTPGIMVGPEVEKTALVRHAARMFVTGASLRVPFFTIILRKSYGLGAQAMAGGSFKAPFFTVSWPTGELGGMGLEGAVKLGFRKELDGIEDPKARQAAYEEMVARMYEHGRALNAASHFEIDDVIDPLESRDRVSRALASLPPPEATGSGRRRRHVDTW